MSAGGGNGKMTTKKTRCMERAGPWLLLVLFLVIYFHQMEAIPGRVHKWKVADERKCPPIEVVVGGR